MNTDRACSICKVHRAACRLHFQIFGRPRRSYRGLRTVYFCKFCLDKAPSAVAELIRLYTREDGPLAKDIWEV